MLCVYVFLILAFPFVAAYQYSFVFQNAPQVVKAQDPAVAIQFKYNVTDCLSYTLSYCRQSVPCNPPASWYGHAAVLFAGSGEVVTYLPAPPVTNSTIGLFFRHCPGALSNDDDDDDAFYEVAYSLSKIRLGPSTIYQIGRAVQQECRDRSRMPSSA
eukprot:TRINITY_DN20445_c0_g1_i1.p1 TRINITY_DN20445_c0_g1~~TRINITY_DN20445_c0_g1_i1.p1  ORF type:complete len:157 (-),score=17.75 TRINITY_DN20445_c0_g1_i1:10-480(-)